MSDGKLHFENDMITGAARYYIDSHSEGHEYAHLISICMANKLSTIFDWMVSFHCACACEWLIHFRLFGLV